MIGVLVWSTEKHRKGEITRLQMQEASKKVKNSIANERAGHIFSKNPEKYVDNQANRQMITKIANDDKNYLGIDPYGKRYYAKTNPDGTQTYVYTQNGEIKGAGYNKKVEDIVKNKKLIKL